MKKKLISVISSFTLFIPLLTGCSISTDLPFTLPVSKTESADFNNFLDETFNNEITSNTLNLHFMLSDPKKYGIDDYTITLGDISKDARSNTKNQLEDTLKKLKSFDYLRLSTDDKLNYDIFSDYLKTQIKLCDYELYEDILSPSNGLHSQLPILLSEYKFNSEKDIEEYLELLTQIDTYYNEVLEFEKEKSKAGLFMNDKLCLNVIDECESFIQNPDDCILISTFENRLNKFDGISDSKKQLYIERNDSIIKEHVIPAYYILISGLTALLGTGSNDGGLCNYKNGKDYYSLLVYSDTGASESVDKIFKKIATQRDFDLKTCSDLSKNKENYYEECKNVNWSMNDESEMIDHLQDSITEDFPEIIDTDYSISYVDESLEDSLAPAFYITAPIDDYKDNTIYINSAKEYSDINYFTTLAHEGYPGHLYQTVMSYDYGLSPFRSIMEFSGFTEGWATYVEMLAYYYADIDQCYEQFLQCNQAATLSLYASSDIGIHYYGWDSDELYKFWADYGIKDKEAIDQVTELILADPGNYLKYYVGYLKFLELKEKKSDKYGDDFSNKAFHEAILKIGPAPFDIIDKYFSKYYDS